MAKKRKARVSQPTPNEQLQVQDQTNDSAAAASASASAEDHEQVQNFEENKQNDEQVQNFEENKEKDEQVQTFDENKENDEQDLDEDEEEEEGEEEEENEEPKQVKVETESMEEEEPVDKLLEPFSKEQLVLLLKEAVSKYPDFIQSVEKIADADPAHRKIFVHGLGWETNTETLISEYGRYGEIEDCKAVVDKVSGKSKGYGFILFKHRSGARKALKEPQKKIGNRITSCQLASAGPVPAPPPTAPAVSEYTQKKIFVSNVAAEIDPQKLLDFFSKFGEIEDGPLGLDKQTGKPKGFALFVYKSLESAKKALEEPHKIFEGHTLHCQKAIDGPKPGKGGFHQQQHQHHHHHQNQHQQYGGHHHHSSKKAKYSGGGGGGGGQGHLMAPSGPAVGYNPAVPPPALTPALGQALTALLATQGAGLGIGNLFGGLGSPANPQGIQPVVNNSGYGNQGGASYQQGIQGGYANAQMGQGGYANAQMGQGGSRPQQGGASYMGHGH